PPPGPGCPARARGRAGRPGRDGGYALARHGSRDRANDPGRPVRDGLLDRSSVERFLGLICGAGVLPARMAGEARRHGWRVLAFTFGDAPGIGEQADRTVPSRIDQAGVVLATLQAERVESVLFSGKFWKTDLLDDDRLDAKLTAMKAEAGAMTDANILQIVAAPRAPLG